MYYKSTRNSSVNVSSAQAIAQGISKDGGLFVPSEIPALTLDEIKAQFEAGTLKVFDTNNFTVGGKKLDTYLADVVTDDAFTPDTEAIKDGAFAESSDRSAPYFDVIIDGITEI